MNKEISPSSTPKYYHYLDILNILACLAVIFMHCNGIVHTYDNTRIWKESMIIETVCYWAVPIFFMITGATLMSYRKKYTTRVFFHKRFIKTVIPFVVWTIVNFFWKMFLGNIVWDDLSLTSFLDLIVNTKIENIYWFFVPLFMVYMSMPVLSLLAEHKYILWYMTGFGFITASVFPVLCRLLDVTPNSSFSAPVAGGYLIFVILGYLLSQIDIEKKYRRMIYLFGIIGILIRYYFTVLWSIRDGQLNQTFWGYMNFPSVFLAIAVFCFIKYLPLHRWYNNPDISLFLSKISSASFGIYLIHMIIYRLIEHFAHIPNTTYIWRYIVPFVIYILSLVIVLTMKKLPLLKRIVP